MRSVLKATAIVALGLFYLGLAYVAAYPPVSDEYRDHYLQRRADCWLSPAERDAGADLPADVAIGGLAYPAACRYLRFRWTAPEPWGAWAEPGTATLRLPWRPEAVAVRLTLRGPQAAAPVQAVLTLGPERAEASVMPGATQTVELKLPPAPDHRAWEVSVHSIGTGTVSRPDPVVPTRDVGIGLERITYLAAP